MRIRTTSDWRESLPFETPVPAAGVLPDAEARCAGCADGALRPADELWVVKHRHPNNPAGYVRVYCSAHAPSAPRPAAAPASPVGRGTARASRAASPRSTPARTAPRRSAPEPVRAVCPNCFVEVPSTGVCGMCGERVA
jgi:hypothetical protein